MIDNCLLYFLYSVIILSTLIIIILLNNVNENDSSLLVPITSTIGLGSILTLSAKYLSNNDSSKNSKKINTIIKTRDKRINNIVKVGFADPANPTNASEAKKNALQNEQNNILEQNNIIFELIKESGLSNTITNLQLIDIYNSDDDTISKIYNELEQSREKNILKFNISECLKQVLDLYISELQQIVSKEILESKDVKTKLKIISKREETATHFSKEYFDRDAIILISKRANIEIKPTDVIVLKKVFLSKETINKLQTYLTSDFKINSSLINGYLNKLIMAHAKNKENKQQNLTQKNQEIKINIVKKPTTTIETENKTVQLLTTPEQQAIGQLPTGQQSTGNPTIEKPAIEQKMTGNQAIEKQAIGKKKANKNAKGENDIPSKLFNTTIFNSVDDNYMQYVNNIDFIKKFDTLNICEITTNNKYIISYLGNKLDELNDLNVEYLRNMVELFILFVYNNNRYIKIKMFLDKCEPCFEEIHNQLTIYEKQNASHLKSLKEKDMLIKDEKYTIEKYKAEKLEFEASYLDNIRQIELKHSADIEAISEKQTAEIEKINNLNTTKITELSRLHAETLNKAISEKDADIKKKIEEIAKLESNAINLNLTNEEKDKRIKKLNEEIKQLKAGYAERIAELNASQTATIDELKRIQDEEIKNLKEKYNTDLRNIYIKLDLKQSILNEGREARILEQKEHYDKLYEMQQKAYNDMAENNAKLVDKTTLENDALKKENREMLENHNTISLNNQKIQMFPIYVRDAFEKDMLYYFKSALSNKDEIRKNADLFYVEKSKLERYLFEISDERSETMKKQAILLKKILARYSKKNDSILSFGIDEKEDKELLENINILKALINSADEQLQIDLLLSAHLNCIYYQIMLYTNLTILNNIIKITNKFSDAFIFKYEISKDYLRYLDIAEYVDADNQDFMKITYQDLANTYLSLLPENKEDKNAISNNQVLEIEVLDKTKINSLRILFDYYSEFYRKTKIIDNATLKDAIQKLDIAGNIYEKETKRLLEKDKTIDAEYYASLNEYKGIINAYIDSKNLNEYVSNNILSNIYVKETFNKVVSKTIKKKPNESTGNAIIDEFISVLASKDDEFNLLYVLDAEDDINKRLTAILEFIDFLLKINSNVIAFLFKQNKQNQTTINKLNTLLENCEGINRKNLELDEKLKKDGLNVDDEIKKSNAEISKLKLENQELIQTINSTNGILYKKFSNIIEKEKLAYILNTTNENYINKIYEFIEIEIKNLKSNDLEKNNEIRMLKEQLEMQKAELQQQLQIKQSELDASIKREADLKVYIAQLENDATKLVSAAERMIKVELEQKMAIYETRLKELQTNISKLQDSKFTVNMALEEKNAAIAQKSRIESELSTEKAKLVELEAKITKLFAEINKKNTEILNNNSMIDRIRNELQIKLPLNELVDKIIKDVKLYKEQSFVVSGLQTSNESLNANLQNLKLNTDNNINSLEAKRKELLKQLAIYKISLSVKDSKIKNIEKAQVKLISENTSIKEDIELKATQILNLEQEQGILNRRIEELTQSNVQLMGNVDASSTQQSEYIKDIELLNKNNAKLQEQINSLQAGLDDSTKALENDTKRLQDEISNAGIVSEGNIKKLMDILRTNLSTIIKLKIKNNTLTKQIDAIQTENNTLKNELLQNETQIAAEKQRNINTTNEKNNKIRELENENKQIQRELLANKGKLSLIKKTIESQKTRIQGFISQSELSEQEIKTLKLKIQELEIAKLQLIETNQMQESELSTKYSNCQSELNSVKAELKNKIDEFEKLKSENKIQNNLNSFNNTSKLMDEINQLKNDKIQLESQLEKQIKVLKQQHSDEIMKLEVKITKLTTEKNKLMAEKDTLNSEKSANKELETIYNAKIKELEEKINQLINIKDMQESELSTKHLDSESKLKKVKTELENKIAEFNKLKSDNKIQNNLNSFNYTSKLTDEINQLNINKIKLESDAARLKQQKSEELLKLEQNTTITIRQLIKDKDKLNSEKLASDQLNEEYNKKIRELEMKNLELVETNRMQESEFYTKNINSNKKLELVQLELKNKIDEFEKLKLSNKNNNNLDSFNKTVELRNEIKELITKQSTLEKQITDIKLQKSQELLKLENEYIIKINKLIKDKEFLESKNMSNEELNGKFNNKIKEISEELSAIKAENGSLKQTINELKKTNSELELERVQLNKNKTTLSNTIEQINTKLKDVEELLQNNELKYNDNLRLKLTQAKAKCVSDLFILEGKNKIIMQLLSKKEKQLNDCNQMKNTIESSLSKEIDKYKNEKYMDSEKIATLEGLLLTNKTKSELIQAELDNNLSKYNDKYSQLNSQILDLNTQITNLQSDNSDLDNDKRTLQEGIELQLEELQNNYKIDQQNLQKIITNLSKFSDKSNTEIQNQLNQLTELNKKYINDININKNNNIKLQFEKINLLNKIKQLQNSITAINNSNSQNIIQLQTEAFDEITRLKSFIKQKENELLQSKQKSLSNETNLLKSVSTISQKENELIKSKAALLNLDREFKIKEKEIIQLRNQIMQFEIEIKKMQMYLDQVKIKNTGEHAAFLERIYKLKIINSNLQSKLDKINKSKLIKDNDYDKQIKLCEDKLNKNITDLDVVSSNLSKCKIELENCTNNINIKNSINKKLEDSINISNSKISQLESDKKNLEEQLKLLKEILSKSNEKALAKSVPSLPLLSLDPIVPNDTHIIYKYVNSKPLNSKSNNSTKLYNTPYDKYAKENGLNTDIKFNNYLTPFDNYNVIK
jgi:hypothetical protein